MAIDRLFANPENCIPELLVICCVCFLLGVISTSIYHLFKKKEKKIMKAEICCERCGIRLCQTNTDSLIWETQETPTATCSDCTTEQEKEEINCRIGHVLNNLFRN